MNKIFAILITFCTGTNVVGQNIKIIGEHSPQTKHQATTFDLIDKSFDLTNKTKVATLKGYSLNNSNSTVVALFNSFWISANGLGANSYHIDLVERSGDSTIVTMDVYYLDYTDSNRNLDLYPRNMVYVIGDVDKKQTAKPIKFNNKKIVLEPMEYVAYQNKVGEDATVSIGGLTGAKAWIKGEEGRLPKHLSVNGFAVAPGTYSTVAVSFNTGRIYPVDLNVGQFLINVLKLKG